MSDNQNIMDFEGFTKWAKETLLGNGWLETGYKFMHPNNPNAKIYVKETRVNFYPSGGYDHGGFKYLNRDESNIKYRIYYLGVNDPKYSFGDFDVFKKSINDMKFAFDGNNELEVIFGKKYPDNYDISTQSEMKNIFLEFLEYVNK